MGQFGCDCFGERVGNCTSIEVESYLGIFLLLGRVVVRTSFDPKEIDIFSLVSFRFQPLSIRDDIGVSAYLHLNILQFHIRSRAWRM